MKFFPLTALICSAALLSLSSCEDVLDKEDLGTATEELVFQDENLAKLNLSYIYNDNLPNWGGSWGLRGDLSDESFGESKYFEGTLLINDVADFGTGLTVTNNYGKIRTINMFIRAVKRAPLSDEAKNSLCAQAYFFRAWRYFDLVRLYGGVPLVVSPQYAVGEEARNATYLPRNTTTATYQQIVSDLDSAAMFLPNKWTASADWGRITSGAAHAFKARALVYAASPQFNPSDNVAKWQAAYAASKQAVASLTAGDFKLHASFDQLWFQEVGNPEAVFVTGFNTSTSAQALKNNGYDNSTRPSYTGTTGGSNQPVWEHVKAYPMLDGKKPGESTKYPYTDQLFYKKRDPRFDKTIAYNGATWPLNGNANYKIWTYFVGGKTTEPKASNTGFYTRKAINPTVSASDAPFIGTDWIEIRYAEVLLNLAESACGINNLPEAYTQLKAIRQRAGLEAGTDGLYGLKAGMSRAEMFEAILYERQIELAFEGKRFWDLRRWKKIESTLNGKRRQGVIITLKPTAPASFATNRDNVDLDLAYTSYFSIAFKNMDTRYAINWKPEYYFFAIPQTAINNNPTLLQNNTWGGGFDPLQ